MNGVADTTPGLENKQCIIVVFMVFTAPMHRFHMVVDSGTVLPVVVYTTPHMNPQILHSQSFFQLVQESISSLLESKYDSARDEIEINKNAHVSELHPLKLEQKSSLSVYYYWYTTEEQYDVLVRGTRYRLDGISLAIRIATP